MCVSIHSERGAANYIREWLRGRGALDYARRMLESWQGYQRWLVGWRLVDRELMSPAQLQEAKEAKEKARLAAEAVAAHEAKLAKRRAKRKAHRAAQAEIDAMVREAGALAKIDPVVTRDRVKRSLASAERT